MKTLAAFGLGITLTLLYASQWGTQSCIALSFSGGILFAVVVGVVSVGVIVWSGQKLGWVRSFTSAHSQTGGE